MPGNMELLNSIKNRMKLTFSQNGQLWAAYELYVNVSLWFYVEIFPNCWNNLSACEWEESAIALLCEET